MKFSESGLPQGKLVEDAFNYSFRQIMSREGESLRLFKQQAEAMHGQNMSMLDADRKKGLLSEGDYEKEREMLEKMRDDQLRMGPQLIRAELQRNFATRRVQFAQEIARNSEAPSEETISAALLVECVRSPLDFSEVENNFGPKVGDIVARILHMEAYPADAMAHLAGTSADTKRVYAALTVVNLDGLSAQAEKLARARAPQVLMFPPGQEEQIFEAVRTTWGNDSKLDKRLVESFNRAAAAVKSPFSIEVDQDGRPDLVKGNPPTPPNKNLPVVTKPKGNGSIGGDVF